MTLERLAIIGVFLLVALIGRATCRQWNNPLTLLSAPWLVIFGGQLLLARDFPFGGRALVVLTVLVLPFVVGSVLAAIPWRDRPVTRFTIERRADHPARWRRYLWASVAVVAVYVVIQLRVGVQQGFISFDGQGVDPYSLSDFLLGSGLAWPFRLTQALSYIAVFMAGIELVRTRRPSLPALLIIGGMIATTLITSVRTPALLSMSVIGVVALLWTHDLFRRPSPRAMMLGAIGLVVIAGLTSTALSRRFGDEHNSQDYIAESAIHSLLSPPSSFSLYLDDSDAWHYGNLNRNSLQGPLALVGMQTRSVTIYSGYYLSRSTNQDPNVFTAFRFLMEDIGLGGTVVFMAVFGFAVSHLFFAFRTAPTIRRGAALSALLMLVMWLPITLLPSYVYWWALLLAPLVVLPRALQLRVESALPATPPARAASAPPLPARSVHLSP